MNGEAGAASTPPDPWRQVRLGILFLLGILAGGTVAYSILGLGPFDAFYQTLITISTVGYAEIAEDTDTAFRVVSSVVILFGVGVALFTLGSVFEAIVEGRLSERVGRARVQRAIDNLRGHIVVCGYGRVGQSITSALAAQGAEVVVVDRRPDLGEIVAGPTVIGEATDDAALRRAGLERARGLVAALDSDADNMYVTLSGRSMNPDLFIVSRSNSVDAEPKLMQAGADRVVSPHVIGGSRMAAFMMQPHVADFLDVAMRDDQLHVRLREYRVDPDGALDGKSVADARLVTDTGVTVLALRRADGIFVDHPDPHKPLRAGDVAIVLGTAGQHAALRDLMSG